MEHLAVLRVSPGRQPPAQGITSSTGARLTDAEGCTSHPVAGEAQGPSLVIKKARFLFKILSYFKRQCRLIEYLKLGGTHKDH